MRRASVAMVLLGSQATVMSTGSQAPERPLRQTTSPGGDLASEAVNCVRRTGLCDALLDGDVVRGDAVADVGDDIADVVVM